MNLDVDLNELRPRMMSVAYRMLGSVADAEDAVQDAFLRLQMAEEVTSPEGFLVKTTTRRCIDHLRADRRHKQQYIGPWVPEPVDTGTGVAHGDMAESLSQAFLLMLERLTPTERAAFLLRNVFNYKFSEVAEVLGKSEVHVRQIISRARNHLTQALPRFRPDPEEADSLVERFVTACQAGDVEQLEHLFTEDVEVYSDGGGKVSAARVVIRGRPRAARFMAGVFSKRNRDAQMHMTTVNGDPGLVFVSGETVIQVVSIRIERDIRSVYMTLNPDKLAHWSVAKVR